MPGAGNSNGRRYRGASAKRLSSAGDIVHSWMSNFRVKCKFNPSVYAEEALASN